MLTKCAFYCLTGFGLYSAILEKSGVAVFCIKTFLIMHFWEKNGKLLFNGLACLQNSSTIFMI